MEIREGYHEGKSSLHGYGLSTRASNTKMISVE
jgi:hypothetical protein